MLKLLIKANFMRLFTPRKKGGKTKIALNGKMLILAYVLLAAVMMFAFGAMAAGFSEASKVAGRWFYFEMQSVTAFMLTVIGSVFYAIFSLYDAKDNDLLLSMPIKPGTIVLSRLTTLAALSLLFDLSVALPFLVVGIINGVVNALSAVLLIVDNLFLVSAAMAIVCLLAWIISVITAKAKRKQLVQSVLMFIAFGLYMVIYPNISRFVQASIADPQHISEIMSRIYPFYVFGMATEGNIAYLLGFIAVSAAAGFIAYYLVQKSFISVVSAKGNAAKTSGKAVKIKAKSIHAALISKELRRFFGSSVYMFNAGVGLLLMLGVSIYFAVGGAGKAFAEFSADLFPHAYAFAASFVMMFMCAMTEISAPSVSLEGKMLWVIRSAPVSAGKVLCAKADAHILISLPFVAVSAVVLAIPSGDFAAIPFVILAVMGLTAFVAHTGVMLNVFFPKFDGESDTRVVKQSSSVILTMLAGVLFAVALVVIGWFIGDASNGYVALAVEAFIGFAAAFAVRYALTHSSAKRFDDFQA